MTRPQIVSQPMTPRAAATAFLAVALAARVDQHERQRGLVAASVLACPDRTASKS